MQMKLFSKFTCYYLLTVFLLLASNSWAQNITLVDIRYIQEHNVEQADKYILRKGFAAKIIHYEGNVVCTQWNYPKSGISNDRFTAFIFKNGTEGIIGAGKLQSASVSYTNLYKSQIFSIVESAYKVGYIKSKAYGTSLLILKDDTYRILFDNDPDQNGAYQLIYY